MTVAKAPVLCLKQITETAETVSSEVRTSSSKVPQGKKAGWITIWNWIYFNMFYVSLFEVKRFFRMVYLVNVTNTKKKAKLWLQSFSLFAYFHLHNNPNKSTRIL